MWHHNLDLKLAASGQSLERFFRYPALVVGLLVAVGIPGSTLGEPVTDPLFNQIISPEDWQEYGGLVSVFGGTIVALWVAGFLSDRIGY